MKLGGTAVLAMLLAGQAFASGVELRSSVPCSGVMHLEPVCDGMECQDPLSVEFVAPSNLSLPSGTWRASFAGSQCWAAPLQIDSTTASIDLAVFATVRGSLATQEEIPDSLSSAVRVGNAADWISNPGVCVRTSTRWTCQVPSIARDLRLDLDGFSSAYYFDLSFAPGKTTLDARTVAQGASIVGRVGAFRGVASDAVEVTARDDARPAARYRAKVNARGFFQIIGLPIGSYSVSAEAKNLSSSSVKVDAGHEREYAIAREIDLRERGSIQVVVNPTPADARWTVRVQRPDLLNADVLTTVARGELDDAGIWTAQGLDSGPHVIHILDEKNQIVHRENVEVADGRAVLPITLDSVPIRGHVSVGSDALEAAVQFFLGGARVTLAADEGGDFSGMLPKEGKWQVQVTPATGLQRIRTASAIEIRRTPGQAYTRVEIVLPAGKVSGIVVNGSGKAIRDAEILIMRKDKIAANAASGPDGRFAVSGLDAGDVQLKAIAGEKESAFVPYAVSENPAEATLVVRENVELSGRVVTERGQPVPGAIVRSLVELQGVREKVTGPSGEFTLPVPDGAVVDVAILARGFPARLQRLSAARDASAVIRLSAVPSFLIVRLAGAPPWPYLRANEAVIPLPALFRPHAGGVMPMEASPEGFVLEVDPGDYAICRDATSANCIPKTLPPSARITIDASNLWPKRR